MSLGSCDNLCVTILQQVVPACYAPMELPNHLLMSAYADKRLQDLFKQYLVSTCWTLHIQ